MRIGGIYEADYSLEVLFPKNAALFLNWADNYPDMTAIAAVYMPDGFIVGADGLRQTTTFKVLDKNAQKLFQFESDKIRLVYAWCGQTVFWNEDEDNQDNKEILFDFGVVTEPILRQAALDAQDFPNFVENFRAGLFASLVSSILAKGSWISNSPSNKLARMLLIGYFNDNPCIAEIKVERVVLMPSMPSVIPNMLFQPSNDLMVFSGYPSVQKDNGLERQPKDLEDARCLIHEYIQRCINDPDCQGIGGKIHVASITPSAFTWVDAPANFTAA